MSSARFLLFLLIGALSPHLAHAQADMDGLWQLTLTPPEQPTISMNVQAETISDSLHLAILGEENTVALPGVALNEKQLQFNIPTGHGTIHCMLHKKDEDAFTGICTGGMGESVTTLKRVVEKD